MPQGGKRILKNGTVLFSKIHGLSKDRFYLIFGNLYRRCNSPKNNRYYRYGDRGINCEWNNFDEFKKDMYKSYLNHCKKFGIKNTQIDRIDTNGNYSKNNCKWSTKLEQARTRSNTLKITINGKTKSLREWCNIKNKKYKTIFYRIKYGNYSIDEAFNK